MSKRRYSDDVKQVASKVMRFNNSESQKGSLKVRLDRPLKRTSEMTGIPRQTLTGWESGSKVNIVFKNEIN